MPRALFSVAGTRGDIQPFVIVGQALQQLNWSVAIVAYETWEDLVCKSGITFYSAGPDFFHCMRTTPLGQAFQDDNTNMKKYEAYLTPFFARQVDANVAAIKEFKPDIVCVNVFALFHGPIIKDLFQIPTCLLTYQPVQPTTEFPCFNIVGHWRFPFGFINKATWYLIWFMYVKMTQRMVDASRVKYGLSKKSTREGISDLVHGYDRYFGPFSSVILPRPADSPSSTIYIGPLLQSSLLGAADPGVVDFVTKGSSPLVYIGFGSMTDTLSEANRTKFLEQVLLAAAALNKFRVVVQLSQDNQDALSHVPLPPSVLVIGLVPHAWLFPLCSVVVFHGGLGTLTAAAAAGTPVVVIPIDPIPTDQQFWGRIATDAGVGRCIYSGYRAVTKKKLKALIEEVATSSLMKSKAIEWSEQVRKEDGYARWVDAFNDLAQQVGAAK